MMLGTSSSSSLVGNSAGIAAAGEAHDSGGSGEAGGAGGIHGGGYSDEDKARIDESERGGGGGNRWPRQETLALLQIRSEMGVAFRDSNLKGPLWEDVSRKMAELGFHRSGKKCKEKFENVYKYHKRTKDGRAAKADGKTYRFFEQLEALEASPSPISTLPPPARLHPQPPHTPPTTTMAATPAVVVPGGSTISPPIFTHLTVSSASAIPVSLSPKINNPLSSSTLPPSQSQQLHHQQQTQLQPQNLMGHPHGNPLSSSHLHISSSLMSDPTSSSSTSSDEDIGRRHKKKRKMKDFFERLMKDVVAKQEELQKKFLETLEKRERERMIREEAWRVQEMARMNRELDLLAQERSTAAAKDAAMMAFLQKMTGQQSPQQNASYNNAPPPVQVSLTQVQQIPLPPPSSLPQPVSTPASLPTLAPVVSTPATTLAPATMTLLPTLASVVPTPATTSQALSTMSTRIMDTARDDNVGENFMTPSSSRWPKTEVEALISLRTNLDVKYLENGPKGPLWEEISAGMSRLGYNRSAKRCKEKWENINKYFKKVKESNKKRPEDSKTCPYFHQLDALYREKTKSDPSQYTTSPYMNAPKPNSQNPMMPLMIRPEQQWPLPRQENTAMEEEDHDSDNMDENDHEDGDDEDDEDEEDEEAGGYEIVTKKQTGNSVSVATTAAE